MAFLSQLPIGLILGLALLASAAYAYINGSRTAYSLARANDSLKLQMHSRPAYHGWYCFLWVFVPAVLVLSLSQAIRPLIRSEILGFLISGQLKNISKDESQLFLLDVQKHAFGGTPSQLTPDIEAASHKLLAIDGAIALIILLIVSAIAVIGFFWSRSKLSLKFWARNKVETWIKAFMIFASAIAVFTTFGIILSLIFETIKFFEFYNPISFIFGTQWSPQVAIRADQVGQSGAFGAVPLFVGTFMIMIIAMFVAVPVGLGSAVFLSEYASDKARTFVKPALELLAGIPTVVYGFFALLTVAPFIRDVGAAIGIETSSQSALAAGVVMGIMIIPFISSLSDDVINSVPQSLRDGSYAMGATKSETISRVILPAALPGIIGSVLLAISRALGETMIVAMAAGQNANLTLNPLEMVTTVTVQIVTLLTGDQEYDSPKTHVAFALGFVLFFVTLILNIIALRVVQKYREKYD